MNAVDVVQRQVDAYNARDLLQFVACYADDIRVYRPPASSPFLAGKADFTEFYRTQRFNLPALHAEIVNRMVLGHRVIDHERITGVREQPYEIAVAYEVVDGRIATVWTFAADGRELV
jgi:hypothetical protein